MGGIETAGGAWNAWQVLLFVVLCISFAGFAAMFIASRVSIGGKRLAASRWGQMIVAALAVSFLAFLAGIVLPQLMLAS